MNWTPFYVFLILFWLQLIANVCFRIYIHEEHEMRLGWWIPSSQDGLLLLNRDIRLFKIYQILLLCNITTLSMVFGSGFVMVLLSMRLL
jgi:hypothetical protein